MPVFPCFTLTVYVTLVSNIQNFDQKKDYTIACVRIRARIVNALRSFVTRVVCAKILAPFFPFPSQFKDDSTFYMSLCRINHTEIKHLFKNRTSYAANCVGSDELELHFE